MDDHADDLFTKLRVGCTAQAQAIRLLSEGARECYAPLILNPRQHALCLICVAQNILEFVSPDARRQHYENHEAIERRALSTVDEALALLEAELLEYYTRANEAEDNAARENEDEAARESEDEDTAASEDEAASESENEDETGSESENEDEDTAVSEHEDETKLGGQPWTPAPDGVALAKARMSSVPLFQAWIALVDDDESCARSPGDLRAHFHAGIFRAGCGFAHRCVGHGVAASPALDGWCF